MDWLKAWVQDSRPVIIGVVHLLPLPGSPRAIALSKTVRRALRDAKSLETGGCDGLIVENYGDAPFYPHKVPPETVAAMSVTSSEIRREVDLPIGINVLRNDVTSAIAISKATGLNFVRANVLTGAYITDQGLLQSQAHKIMRYRDSLRSKVEILADVRVKHASPMMLVPIEEEARDAVDRGLADGLILTGARTGIAPDLERVRIVRKELVSVPIFIGSGLSPSNINMLELVDGGIVGTYFRGGLIGNPVDPSKVRELVDLAKSTIRR